VRIRLVASLGEARIHLQVDVAFGDAVKPHPEEADYPVLLPFPAPHVRIYPREAVVAEKFQIMVALGIANSRMKDFADVWSLARAYRFDGRTLGDAIEATFARRKTRCRPNRRLLSRTSSRPTAPSRRSGERFYDGAGSKTCRTRCGMSSCCSKGS